MGKNAGKKFEEDFIKSVPDGCDITRLKDAGGWSNATNTRFTISNPCDFIIWSDKTRALYKLELKSVQGKSLPFSSIKEHQLNGLLDSAAKNVIAVFVVNFRAVNETYYIPAKQMQATIIASTRKSLSLADARLSGFQIKQTRIRIRWRYDLEWL